METEFQTKFRAIGAYIEECAKQFSVVLNPSSGEGAAAESGAIIILL